MPTTTLRWHAPRCPVFLACNFAAMAAHWPDTTALKGVKPRLRLQHEKASSPGHQEFSLATPGPECANHSKVSSISREASHLSKDANDGASGRKSTKHQTCLHKRRRSECSECGGSQICSHQKIRRRCRDCAGSQICVHGRDRCRCRECRGSQICPHDRSRSDCIHGQPSGKKGMGWNSNEIAGANM